MILEEDVSHAITAIGVNCTAPRFVNQLLETLSDMSIGRLIVAYPNKGEEWNSSTQEWLDVSSSMCL